MKLSDKQRQELFDALRDPELPEAASVDAIGQLDEIIAQDIDRIEPIIARWLSKQSLLEKALQDLLADPYWQKRIACVENGFGTATEYGQVVLRAQEALEPGRGPAMQVSVSKGNAK